MRRKQLGDAGPAVGVLALGTMGLGGRYARDESADAAHLSLIREAAERGVTLFDTAEVYGDGHGEELLGTALDGCRERVVISTKFSAHNSSYHAVIAAAEASLRRLGTHRIDIYQAHWPNPAVPLEETARALNTLWRAGKIGFVGLSNVSVRDTRQMRDLLPGDVPIIAMQQDYSLAERFAEYRLLPLCRAAGMALIAYSPMAQGRLAAFENNEAGIVLAEVAVRNGLSPAQMALNWVAAQDGVVPLSMTSRREHLVANVEAVTTKVPDADILQLTRSFERPVLEIPTDAVEVVGSHTGKAYRTLDEALANPLGLAPSPTALAEELKQGDMLKPVKLRRPADGGGRYQLFEGQLRYWAWVIAHGGTKPITATIHGENNR